ncbi:hypothetical protein [Calothrix sp. 336/3]|nr:hypothetical protein [Calothrix sp. 336/3]
MLEEGLYEETVYIQNPEIVSCIFPESAIATEKNFAASEIN